MSNKNTSNGEKFKTIRKHLHLTQSEFATKLGIGQSYYSAIETGRKQPSMYVIESVFGLGVSSEWYYNGSGDIIRDNSNISELSELVKTNNEQITQYFRGSDLKPFNYEYLQIKYYEQFNTSRINQLIDSECHELEGIYNSYVKLTEILHYLGGPEFLLEKFQKEEPFTSEIRNITDELNEIEFQDEKLKKILYLMSLKMSNEHWVYLIQKITDYMFMYKDMIKEDIIKNHEVTRSEEQKKHDD